MLTSAWPLAMHRHLRNNVSSPWLTTYLSWAAAPRGCWSARGRCIIARLQRHGAIGALWYHERLRAALRVHPVFATLALASLTRLRGQKRHGLGERFPGKRGFYRH